MFDGEVASFELPGESLALDDELARAQESLTNALIFLAQPRLRPSSTSPEFDARHASWHPEPWRGGYWRLQFSGDGLPYGIRFSESELRQLANAGCREPRTWLEPALRDLCGDNYTAERDAAHTGVLTVRARKEE